jgi:hypothetical protein
MANQTELRIIEVIKKFVIYMLTENDEEKIIYSKLNELDDEELQNWVNDELEDYLLNECDYTEGDIVIESQSIMGWLNEDISGVDTCNIFTDCSELMDIQRTLIDFDMSNFYGEGMIRLTFNEDLIQYYCYMYIHKMDPTYLKEYIINLLDPVEPK